MKIFLIHNPYSARWESGKRRGEIEEALNKFQLNYQIITTNKPGDGIEAARKAAKEGFEAIIAAGGDGTINEVVNGILSSDVNIKPKFGIFPTGTANDLVSNLGMSSELDDAASLIANGRTNKMDICEVNGHFFANNAGLGLEPYITVLQENMKKVKGIFRYLIATLVGISHNPQWDMKLTWDTGEYSGPTTLISISNGARTGGIFYTVPHADLFDGELSFSYGHIPTRGKILSALPMILKSEKGNITEHPAVSEINSSKLSVEISTPSPLHADGELVSYGITEAKFQIHPKMIEIFSP